MSNTELIEAIQNLTEAVNNLKRTVEDNTIKTSSNTTELDHLYKKMGELELAIGKLGRR